MTEHAACEKRKFDDACEAVARGDALKKRRYDGDIKNKHAKRARRLRGVCWQAVGFIVRPRPAAFSVRQAALHKIRSGHSDCFLVDAVGEVVRTDFTNTSEILRRRRWRKLMPLLDVKPLKSEGVVGLPVASESALDTDLDCFFPVWTAGLHASDHTAAIELDTTSPVRRAVIALRRAEKRSLLRDIDDELQLHEHMTKKRRRATDVLIDWDAYVTA